MAEQPIVVIYRTGEHSGTYRGAYTITFNSDTAFIQGLSGRFTRACALELMAYLIMRGIIYCEFYRRKGDIVRKVRRKVSRSREVI